MNASQAGSSLYNQPGPQGHAGYNQTYNDPYHTDAPSHTAAAHTPYIVSGSQNSVALASQWGSDMHDPSYAGSGVPDSRQDNVFVPRPRKTTFNVVNSSDAQRFMTPPPRYH